MADESEFEDGGPRGNDFAAHLAMGAASEEAREYLRKQNELANLQIEDLKRENAIRHWSLRVRHISDVLKLGFELALAFIVIAIAIGLGFEIWAAARADGLVIDAFNVPPAMADKGLTGQVVASKLLDRLTVLQNETVSSREASSFTNDWTNDIKVEIPDTGVSLGEVVRYLHATLGHEMHLSGEMYQTAAGAALTVRMDNDAGQTFTASPGDLDTMIQRAALAVYARAQPYRYSVYLDARGKIAEAYAVDKALAETGPESERPWAYIGMGNALQNMGRFEKERYYLLLAQQMAPDLVLARNVLKNADDNAGHEQAAFGDVMDVQKLLKRGGDHGTTQKWRDFSLHYAKLDLAELTGDYRAAAGAMLAQRWFEPIGITTQSASDLALAHDPKAALAMLQTVSGKQLVLGSYDSGSDSAAFTLALVAAQRGDLLASIDFLLRDQEAGRAFAIKTQGLFSDRSAHNGLTAPMLAVLYARTGQWAKADAQLRSMPDDCDICARAHGNVEALRHNWNAAARWFALVSARSPDIPLADSDWGAMLLAKGDFDGAIAKFASASQKGPHFADPLEMWGEALIAKNRSDLALAKFAEAAKYAPNWGRLHLKWGEALLWSGDKGDARKQFASAAGLDLTPSEIAELARVMHG